MTAFSPFYVRVGRNEVSSRPLMSSAEHREHRFAFRLRAHVRTARVVHAESSRGEL